MRDELILALDRYVRSDPLPSSADDPRIIALSETLPRLPLVPIVERRPNFRNPAGVYFKLRNFHYIATDDAGGYANYGAADEAVYREFNGDRARLAEAAEAIRQALNQPDLATADETLEEDEAPEGRILLRLHRARERNAALVRRRKQEAMRKHGGLRCEVCGFDFVGAYGPLGRLHRMPPHGSDREADAPARRRKPKTSPWSARIVIVCCIVVPRC